MLLELQIRDFAIIDHLKLGLQNGFTVLTGETGAGKSIIIDALGTLRGEKVTPSMVRAGCVRARVEGVFSLIDCPHIIPILQGYGLWDEEDEPLILTREINAETGRSTARINNRAVNTNTLRDIGGRLIDIHGQHEGLSIFNTRTHLDMLDRYGGLLPLREEVQTLYTTLRQVHQEIAAIRQGEAQREERIKELQLLLEDVQSADLHVGEEDELIQERSVLQNAARIAELMEQAYVALSQGVDDPPYSQTAIVDAMAGVTDNIQELARLDPAATSIAEQAADVQFHLEDLAANLRDYIDQFAFEPHRLDEIEDRLTVIRKIQRVHGGCIAEILERATHAEEEIARLTHSDDYRTELEQREQSLLQNLGEQATKLSLQRAEVGETLSRAIEESLGDLALPYVRFAVAMEQTEDPQGVPVPHPLSQPISQPNAAPKKTDQVCYQIMPTGIDRVEFLMSPNPGEPLKPLVRIASGGESARVLLALKSILSRVDTVPTLIFDEVDAGVGGRAGQVVGNKLWAITDYHQVICITHLPQVAAFADTHYAISKSVETAQHGDRYTRTHMHVLSLNERIDELAAMLDGTPVSEHSRASAREIIERANAIKSGERQP
jgi:DNA repair protein RecN (Recombination protein N)